VPGGSAPRPCHRAGIFPALKERHREAHLPADVVTLGVGVAVLLALCTACAGLAHDTAQHHRRARRALRG